MHLKHQGIIIRGNYEINDIPEPSNEDIKAYVRFFYPWLRTNFIDKRPVEARTIDATVNTLLYELRLYVWDVQDEYLFNKDEVLHRFLKIPEGKIFCSRLQTVRQYLNGAVATVGIEELEALLREISTFVRNKVQWSN